MNIWSVIINPQQREERVSWMREKGKENKTRMTGAERQILKIVKQLKNADEEKTAARMGVSTNYVNNLCSSLMQEGFLKQIAGEYRLTSKGSKIVLPVRLKTGSKLIPAAQPGKYRTYNMDKKEAGAKESQLHQCQERYHEGEIAGEIKMKCDIPPREKVEAALKRNPQLSYEQAEDQMTSHTLFCPAKGKEVTPHYCSSCPHQEKIDFKRWTVQCKYEFTERRLDMVYEEHVNLPQIVCPIFEKLIVVGRCIDCRYQREREWEKGWVLCGAPSHLEPKDKEIFKVVYGEKEMLMIPPAGIDRK